MSNVEKRIRVVCATRVSREDFFERTALGQSLKLYQSLLPFELDLYEWNSQGLPVVYNRSIESARDRPVVLMFVHDDVYLSDFFWYEKVLQGLARFHLIGVAGNRRRLPRQPSWAFANDRFVWDEREHLSGVVGHGRGFPCDNIMFYGHSGQSCKLLDGLLLAVEGQTLHAQDIRFDSRFKFHFYDMDLCRQFEMKGLAMGTWPIGVIHRSLGPMGVPAWREGWALYCGKYPD